MWNFTVHPSCSHDHSFCVQTVVIEALLGFTGGTEWAGSRNNGRGYCSCRVVACPPGGRPLLGWTSWTRETPPRCSGGWVIAQLQELEDMSKWTFNLKDILLLAKLKLLSFLTWFGDGVFLGDGVEQLPKILSAILMSVCRLSVPQCEVFTPPFAPLCSQFWSVAGASVSLTVTCLDPRLPPSFGDLGTNLGTNVVTIPSSISVFPSFSCNMAQNFRRTEGLLQLRSTRGHFCESE